MKRSLFLLLILIASTAGADVVQPIGAAPQILIAVAGSVAGANGTFFRSDIALLNLASHDQMVVLQWLSQSGSAMAAAITLPAQSGMRSADFVTDRLGQTGLGAILVTGVSSFTAGGPVVADPSARLYASVRIWTPQQGTNGTTSQSLPAIPANTINTPTAALFSVGGADEPPSYRTNVGIVNIDPTLTQTFVLTIVTPAPPGPPGPPPRLISVTVPPMSMEQIPVGSGLTAGTQININPVSVNGGAVTTRWVAYGSTINNVTGDAWSELAVTGTQP